MPSRAVCRSQSLRSGPRRSWPCTIRPRRNTHETDKRTVELGKILKTGFVGDVRHCGIRTPQLYRGTTQACGQYELTWRISDDGAEDAQEMERTHRRRTCEVHQFQSPLRSRLDKPHYFRNSAFVTIARCRRTQSAFREYRNYCASDPKCNLFGSIGIPANALSGGHVG